MDNNDRERAAREAAERAIWKHWDMLPHAAEAARQEQQRAARRQHFARQQRRRRFFAVQEWRS